MKTFKNHQEIIDLVEAFIKLELPKEQWTHAAHLTMGVWHLQNHSFEEAMGLMRIRIISYNRQVGTVNSLESGYHETMTWLWLKIIQGFLENKKEDLLDSCNHLLSSDLASKHLPLLFYSRERLFSVQARCVILEPDKASLNLAGLDILYAEPGQVISLQGLAGLLNELSYVENGMGIGFKSIQHWLQRYQPDRFLVVYGSLAPGRENYHIVEYIEGTWTKGIILGEKIMGGWGSSLGYPALKIGPDAKMNEVEAFILESKKLAPHWDRLDEFEGESYKRVLIPFLLEDGREGLGHVYIFNEDPNLNS